MTLFEYNCKEHGLFELMRPLGLRKHPAPCPDCGKLAPRAYSMPSFALVEPGKRKAIERNEKSRFEPHVCGPSCGHEQHGLAPSHLKFLEAQKRKPRAQSYNGPRSWVIEHAV